MSCHRAEKHNFLHFQAMPNTYLEFAKEFKQAIATKFWVTMTVSVLCFIAFFFYPTKPKTKVFNE